MLAPALRAMSWDHPELDSMVQRWLRRRERGQRREPISFDDFAKAFHDLAVLRGRATAPQRPRYSTEAKWTADSD